MPRVPTPEELADFEKRLAQAFPERRTAMTEEAPRYGAVELEAQIEERTDRTQDIVDGLHAVILHLCELKADVRLAAAASLQAAQLQHESASWIAAEIVASSTVDDGETDAISAEHREVAAALRRSIDEKRIDYLNDAVKTKSQVAINRRDHLREIESRETETPDG